MESERSQKSRFPRRSPWLVYLEKNRQTFSKISREKQSYSKAIPESQGSFIDASFYGWLVFNHSFQIILLNPITKERISLPALKLPDIFYDLTYAFTSSPDDDHDFAFLVFCNHRVFSCRPRDNPRWGIDELQIEQGSWASVSKPVSCNGLIYAWLHTITHPVLSLVTVKVNVVVDDHGDSITSVILTSLQVESTNFLRPFDNYSFDSSLIESCGRVYQVYVTFRPWESRVSIVQVWELDLEKNRWVEVKSLGGRAFFLDKFGCAWCWESVDVEGNSVYFRDVNTNLCQFTLKDRRVKILPCPDLQSRRHQFLWFTPQHKASVVDEDVINIVHSDKLLSESETTEEDVHVHVYLPQHIIQSISEYLHWFDYLNLRSTCKSIQSLLSPSWKRTYDNSNTHPLFVSLKDYDGVFEIVDLFRNDSRSLMISIPIRGSFLIDFYKDGWVVVSNGGSAFHFFNLFTRMKKDFPPLQFRRDFVSFGFSTCPDSSNCVVVGIVLYRLRKIWYIRSGDKNWKLAKFDSVHGNNSASICSPIYHNGGFYFLDRRGRVGVFELVGEKETWLLYGSPQLRDMRFMSCHLVDCDGQLFSVFIGELGNWIQVFRFDDLEKNWLEVKSLGKYVFFVSRSASLSTVARDAGMGDRIYLPRLHENRFMFYSLQTCKYHVVGTQLSRENFVSSAEPLHCSWV